MISTCFEECSGYIQTQAPTMCYVIDGIMAVILIASIVFCYFKFVKVMKTNKEETK